MNKKRADDIINKCQDLSSNVYDEKENLKLLDNLRDDYTSIRKAMDKSIELIRKSTVSKELNRELNEMYENNSKNYRDIINKIDEERIKTEKRLKAIKKEINKEDKKISEDNNKKE